LNAIDIGESNISRPGKEVFKFKSEVGRLTVFHAMDLLHVRISDAIEDDYSGEEDEEQKPFFAEAVESLSLQAEYQATPDGAIVPSALYTRSTFVVRIQDEGRPYIGRYVPKYLPDGQAILESETYGGLSQDALNRLHYFVRSVIEPAEHAARKSDNHLQLVQP
jgi:hypothetical protein